jgi:hypothetical protein
MIPNDLIPVIAQIEHLNDLGTSKWYEVVYYSDGEWYSYFGSNTFKDGEKVLRWKYCEDVFKTKETHTFIPNKGGSRTESPDSDLIINHNGKTKRKI